MEKFSVDDMKHHILYLKAERPKRWAFLQEQLAKVHPKMTLSEGAALHEFVKDIFSGEPYEYDTFLYLFWEKVGEWF